MQAKSSRSAGKGNIITCGPADNVTTPYAQLYDYNQYNRLKFVPKSSLFNQARKALLPNCVDVSCCQGYFTYLVVGSTVETSTVIHRLFHDTIVWLYVCVCMCEFYRTGDGVQLLTLMNRLIFSHHLKFQKLIKGV